MGGRTFKFQVMERVNNNAYKIDLPGEYNMSSTFNVSDFSPFDVVDLHLYSRTNHFCGGEDDENMEARRCL
jgi:hypothetical protein